MQKLLNFLAGGQHFFIQFLRIAVFIVMAWIGVLKAFPYEAEGIVPFAANSPLMSFFYKDASKQVKNGENEIVKSYQLYKNPEGKMVKANSTWHKENGTYTFSYGLGFVILSIGLLTLLGIGYPKLGLWGGLLTFLMSLVTMSFLITTPEVYVPDLGGDMPTPTFGFPYLSGAGRLVLKDIIMMAGGLILASESASRLVQNKKRVVLREIETYKNSF